MKSDTGAQNEAWAKKLIGGLVEQGVDYFCCGPGSRSSSLALAIASHPKARYTVHFDERGLCFHALGYAKATKKPAVVMVTSGTAIGNLMPAIMEANNERVSLIILSADRPPELRDCGANQTCDQVKLFSNFVRFQIDLPCADDRISDRYLASTISHAVAMAMGNPAGPVHINCMFREPLFAAMPLFVSLEPCVHFEHPVLHPSDEVIAQWVEKLSKKRQGVIIVGSSALDLTEAVLPLAKQLQWPVFADILSSCSKTLTITHSDLILKVQPHLEADAIIQFGDRFVSKTLNSWLEKQTPDFYLHVSSHPMRQDPSHLITHRVQCSPEIFTRKLLNTLPYFHETTWIQKWIDLDNSCKENLDAYFTANDSLTEPALLREIASFLNKEWSLFLGNSMPIRDANQFFLPKNGCHAIFGNRGVSGIDGNIAIIAGLVEGTDKPLIALIGDLTFLHDLNSLAMLHKLKHPVIVCVVNNGGGGIFSFLPIAKKKEAFEEFFAAAHQLSFSAAAELFGLPYFYPTTLDELKSVFSKQKYAPHACIIEITTDRSENYRVHEQITTNIATCLHLKTTHSPVEIQTTLH